MVAGRPVPGCQRGKVLGHPIDDLLRTPRAERYREQLREMARRAREAGKDALMASMSRSVELGAQCSP